MTEGIANMLQALEAASRESHNPPPPEAIIVSRPIHTGRPGRPQIELTQSFWKWLLTYGVPQGLPQLLELLFGLFAEGHLNMAWLNRAHRFMLTPQIQIIQASSFDDISLLLLLSPP